MKTISINKEEWGAGKSIPDNIREPALLALSHYPELKLIRIRFVLKKNTLFPYASRPLVSSLLKAPRKRMYLIIIQTNAKWDGHRKILLENLPYEARVGILGHELAHVVDYLRRDFFSMIGMGLMYFIPACRKRIERETDLCAIRHGLARELFAHATYIRSIPGYMQRNTWINKFYLKPEEILAEIS